MSPQSKHVLVLEDNPTHRRVVELMLSQAGFKVTAVAEAVKALWLAKEEHFDLVITDYYLPDYPGTDFVRLLREIDEYQHVPVILLTARADELNVQRLSDDLLVLVLSKLSSVRHLRNTVCRCLATARCLS